MHTESTSCWSVYIIGTYFLCFFERRNHFRCAEMVQACSEQCVSWFDFLRKVEEQKDGRNLYD